MFQTVRLSIIKSFSLYTQQWYISYRFADSLRAGSGWNILILLAAVSKQVRHIILLCVQWKTPDDGQRNCPKLVEFNSKNKFEKLVHLFVFIIRNRFYCTPFCRYGQLVHNQFIGHYIHKYIRLVLCGFHGYQIKTRHTDEEESSSNC